MAWDVFRCGGTVSELHELDLIDGKRSIWTFEPSASAVALGSTQQDDVLDAAAVRRLGLDVTRRRSGGGIVIVEPSGSAWVDVVIGADDPLWSADVGTAFMWVGEAWARAAHAVRATDQSDQLSVHTGAPLWAGDSRIVCFAGVGVGEVHIDGRKLVGMSQRRTRIGARFQCLVHHDFRADLSFDVLAAPLRTDHLRERLRTSVATAVDLELLVDAFIDELQNLPG